MDHKILSSIINPLSILTFFILFKNSLSKDQNFIACAPQQCGDKHKISFPFWIQGVQESYCGYPGFNVSCSNDSHLTIKLPDEKVYVIQKIWYKNQSLHVYSAEAAYRNPCIQYTAKNLTFSSSDKLKFIEPDVGSLFLYFDCETPLPATFTANNVSCDENGKYGVVVLGLNGPKVQQLVRMCKKGLKFPVELYGPDSFMNLTDLYETLMIRGFGMEWFGMELVAGNCRECHNSGGRCGFFAEADEFWCFCADRPYQTRCPPRKSKRMLIAAIVIPTAAAIIMLLLVLVFLQRRHYKRKFGSSNLLARNISSDPYSKSNLERGNFCFGIPIFPYSELEEATNRFDPTKELGDGGFGTVYYGKLQDGREVAVKRLYENNCKRVEQFMNEIKILTLLRHKNLVSLYGCTSRHSRELLLVYEYIPNGTVADHLHGDMANPSPLTWPIRMSIAVETATALAYLHASDIIHRDVKTNNILLDDKFSVKVADFGLSRLFPINVTHVSTAPQGTPGYVDPEYHQCYQLTEKSDVFSFGVVLIELISSMPAVDITRHRQEINLSNLAINRIQNQAFSDLIDPKLGFNSDCRVKSMTIAVAELAFRCLQNDKEMRPSMEEVLSDLMIIDSQEYDEYERETVKKAAPHSHDSDDDASLLKNMRVRPMSPTSVAEKWISESAISSGSG